MPDMPDKPDTCARLWEALSNPLWQGTIMAILISALRVLYDVKETSTRRIVFEALICGGLSLSASSVIEWMAWPSSLSVAAGGMKVEDLAFELMADPERIAWTAQLVVTHKAPRPYSPFS